MLSVILFAASLTQDAFCVSGICSDWPGWSILLFGVLGHTSWFANPLLGASWIASLFARRIPALVLALAALVLAGSFMFETSVITNEARHGQPGDRPARRLLAVAGEYGARRCRGGIRAQDAGEVVAGFRRSFAALRMTAIPELTHCANPTTIVILSAAKDH